MGSMFVNAALVAGVALAAIPFILHLLMKQTPKRVVFPALRLIKERQKQAKKRLRIKHWLLLAARMLLLALMALALARPRIDAKATVGDSEIPTALGFVFDTSLSMGYSVQEKSRLDEAKRLALEILTRSHESCQVFVVDTSEPGVPAGLTLSAGRKRIEGLGLRPIQRPLNASLGQAYAAVAASDRGRKEVYVMTDLSAAAWRRGEPVDGLELAEKIPGGMKTFVLNVGSKAQSNISVLDIGTGGGSGVGDGPLAIRGRVRNSGQKDQRVVSLWIDGQKKDQKAVELPADGVVDTPVFHTPKLTPGLHQLELRADSSPDPLAIDDTRYLTVDLAPPQKVLVISDRRIDADFVASALDPLGLDPGTPRPFQVDRVLAPQAADHTARLRDYAAVFLLNVAHLDPVVWTRLQSYVREGGGLVVAPGERTREGAAEYNSGTAAALLPCSIGTLRDHRAEFFTFGKAEAAHPIFAQSGTSLPDLLTQLGNVPIHRSLEVTPAKESTVLLRYQDGSPALLERTFSGNPAGHVLLWTTALARRPDPNSPEAWNEFPMPTAGWGFLVVMDQTIPYLAGTIGQKRTVEAGEDVVLAIDSSKRFTGYTLLGPETRQTERLNAPITQGSLLVSQPAQVGHWKVTATGPDGAAQTLGFSVNVPTAELDLRPMTAADLDGLLGKDKYGLATGLDELKRVQGEERVGRELFPWVMLGILVLVTIESLLANTFYKESGPGRTSSPPAAAAQPAPSAA